MSQINANGVTFHVRSQGDGFDFRKHDVEADDLCVDVTDETVIIEARESYSSWVSIEFDSDATERIHEQLEEVLK